jgi:hypothetical protein
MSLTRADLEVRPRLAEPRDVTRSLRARALTGVQRAGVVYAGFRPQLWMRSLSMTTVAG